MNSPIQLQGIGELALNVIESTTDLTQLEKAWRALEPQMPHVPFLTYDWFLTWWEHWGVRRPMIRDKLSVVTFSDRHAGLVGIAPLILTCRPGYGLIATRELQSFGIDPNLTELRSIAVPEQHRTRIYDAFMRHLNEHPREWDWLVLSSVPKDDALVALIDASPGKVTWLRDVPNYVIHLPNSFETLKATLPRNIKESLRKCYNSLKRVGLGFELRVTNGQEELAAELAVFFELHRARAELQDTIRHRDAFRNQRSRDFLHAICERFASLGRLRMFQLLLEGKVVATRIAFVCQDHLYLYFSGYDPTYRQYSIMTTLLAEILRYAIQSGYTAVNLSTGKDESKLRWRPTEALFSDVLVISPMRRSIIAHELTSFGKQKLHDLVVKHRALDFLARRRD